MNHHLLFLISTMIAIIEIIEVMITTIATDLGLMLLILG